MSSVLHGHSSKSRRHPTIKITNAGYAGFDLLLANSCSDAEKLLHLLKFAAGEIGLKVNAGKIKTSISTMGQIKILQLDNKRCFGFHIPWQ